MQRIDIYTDGACSGNPGKGGAAAVIVPEGKTPADGFTVSSGYALTTNNRMEIIAAALGLEPLATLFHSQENRCDVTVHTDSQLVFGTMTLGWRRKMNTDCWSRLDKAVAKARAEGFRIRWNKVDGHAGNAGNEAADKAAVEARNNGRLANDYGYVQAAPDDAAEEDRDKGGDEAAARKWLADNTPSEKTYAVLAEMLTAGELSLESLARHISLHINTNNRH